MPVACRRRMTAQLFYCLFSLLIFGTSHAFQIPDEYKTSTLARIANLPVPLVETKNAVTENTPGYVAYTFGGTFFVTPDGTLTHALVKMGGGWALSERVSSDVAAAPTGITPLGTVATFIGNNPPNWLNRSSYSSIGLGQISQGITLSVTAFGDRIEKQFRIAPGAAVSSVSVQTAGADVLTVAETGDLLLSGVRGSVKLARPVAFQEEGGIRTVVDCSYSTNGTMYGIVAGFYDTTKELVITVSLLLEPATGYANGDPLNATLDENGNVIIAGSSGPLIVPSVTGPFEIAANGSKTLVVARYNAPLDTYPTLALIGGTGTDRAVAIDVAATGSIFLAGSTTSADFPATSGTVSTTNQGAGDAFAVKFDRSLHTLQAATYLGGSGYDEATSLVFATDGTVNVSGITASSDFPGISIFPDLGQSTSFTFSIAIDSNLSSLLASSVVVTPATVTASAPTTTTSSEASTGTTTAATETTTAQTSGTTGTSDAAELSGPGWLLGTADAVHPDQAEAYFSSLQGSAQAKISLLGPQGFGPMSATTASNEITELARALRYNPKLIYDFVHNNIDYVPYFGSTKGATLTLLDGSGNDFDQASLMIALLRASGYTAQYVYGKMTIPGTDVANWLGTDVQYQAVGNVIASGGIPVSMYADAKALMDRVWVKANIGSTDYFFDPAFKTYTYPGKIDLPTAMSYNQADFLSGATTGATVGTDYVQNLNETNIKTRLATYANNLAATIRSQHANKSIEEIIGGRNIVQSYLTQYTTTLPFTPTVTYTWNDIPATHNTTIRIQHAGIDYTANTQDFSGKRLTLTYAGVDNHPELRLDGSLLVSGTATTLGSKNTCTVIINHPYAASSGTYMDQTVTYSPESGRNYAIVYNFGGVSDTLLQKRQQQLDSYKAQGLADTTESVLGETLHIMGMTWLKEVTQSMKLLSGVAETVPIMHHNVGFMCQESGYYIDVKAGAGSILSKHNIDADKTANFKMYPLIGSAFEHGILEQLAGSDKPGVSTMKLFQIANSTNRKVYLASSTNYAAIRPLLANYATAELDDFQSQVSSGRVLVLPDNGQLVLNQWKGKGYISKYFNGSSMSMGMIIGGNYFGGYAAIPGTVSTPTITQNTQTAQVTTSAPTTINLNISIVPPSTSKDPVDMAGGSFLFDRTDLALGGPAPLGVAFSRSYTSADAMTKRSMGYGWGHNYDIWLTPTSHGEPGIGLRQPVDAAAMIASLYVGYDLLKNYDTPTAWLSSSLASKWAIDQVIDNAMVVHIGKKVMEFVKLADGTYASPPGITTKLIKNGDGTFSLVERFGSRINFNSNKQASQIIDIDGNTQTFTYSGTTLTSVRDAFNRTLTFGYDTSSRVNRITDSTGRFVTFGYNATHDLTIFTDPENKSWGYGYDASHRMTTLTNPLTITTATNAYDSLGRVMTQTVPRQGVPGTTATYNFYFSGFRNSEVDPAGNTTTYYYDQKGREFAVENALGQKSIRQFDGQNHTAQSSDPRSNSSNFQYDNNHNLSRITDPFSKATVNVYDAQFRLTDSTEPLGQTSHFDYDSEHHITLFRNGAGNESLASYYGNGLRNTATNGRNTQSVFTYDGYGNPLTAKSASHPQITYGYDVIGRMTSLTDQLGSQTTFTYDKRNLLTQKTDPLGKTTGFTYYNDGKFWTKTDRNGATTTYSYTPSGKLDNISYPGGSTSFIYNLLDQLTAMQDGIGTTSYGYDTAGRLSATINPFGFAIGYTFDAAGNISELTYPGSKKVIYSYDALNRVKTVTIDWLPGKPVATYSYDDAGRMTGLTTFNGITTTYGYDGANRLTSSTSPVASYSFTLDGNGNRTNEARTEPLQLSNTTAMTAYSYNDKGNRLQSAGTASFGYDNEGQISSGYGSGYGFDYEHRLTSTAGASYSYDGAGNRLQAIRSGTTTRYIYDARGNLLAEADTSNTITSYYVHGAGLLSMVQPTNETYCYHFNTTGSTVAMTDSSQSQVNKYAYDPFGNIGNQVETITQPFKYVGQFGVMSEPNGFYYMKARYYDPQVGRFVSEDPLGFDGGDVNLMAYVGNQPVDGIDPSGQSGIFGAVVGGIGGAIGGATSGLIKGDGSITGAILGGLAGGLVGATVGILNPYAGTSLGEAAGAIVGGFIGGGAGEVTSSLYDGKPLSWSSVGQGALSGATVGIISSPGVAITAQFGSVPTALMGVTGGIIGDTIVGTGTRIYGGK